MPEALIRIRSPYKFLEESLYNLYIALPDFDLRKLSDLLDTGET